MTKKKIRLVAVGTLLSITAVLGCGYLSKLNSLTVKIQPAELPISLISQGIQATGIAVSPNGFFIAATDFTNSPQLLDRQTGKKLKTFEGKQGTYPFATFSPDSTALAAANRTNQVVLWNTSSGQAKMILNRQNQLINRIIFSLDGESLASSSDDKTIKIWDGKTGQLRQTFNAAYPLFEMSFAKNGNLLYAADEFGTVYEWSLVTNKLIRKIATSKNKVPAVAFSSNEKLMARRDDTGTISFWSLETGNVISTIKNSREPFRIAFSPDSRILAVAHSSDRIDLATGGSGFEVLKIWDVETGRLLAQSDDWQSISGLAFDPTGKEIITCDGSGGVLLWDISKIVDHL
ncbi:MAG: hypothetical protein KME42_15550 [Tildeniella nuda ZEHNDER 1965/U140]|jgi:WD40 repeat protein|nr:hypothetical protein [Tildeniella nuda ZEHNDER 1965/U140]